MVLEVGQSPQTRCILSAARVSERSVGPRQHDTVTILFRVSGKSIEATGHRDGASERGHFGVHLLFSRDGATVHGKPMRGRSSELERGEDVERLEMMNSILVEDGVRYLAG